MRSTERNEPAATGRPETPSVLGRALAVLGAFDESYSVLGLADIARRADLPKSTVHRIVAEMCRERLLDRDSEGCYRLGLRLFELGELVPQHRTLSAAALPIMEDLREATRQRIHLAVLEGVDVVYVEILGSTGTALSSRTGGRLPAHATGLGKALLAYSPAAVVKARIDAGLPRLTPRTIATPGGLMRELRDVRSEGTAYDREESHVGISCVAAPVFGSDRKVRAALSVTGPTPRIDPGRLGVAVRTAALSLSRQLRASGL
ncbi:MAG TPA: IclR family transcriptional regulator [Pengzhenrongella sp.]